MPPKKKGGRGKGQNGKGIRETAGKIGRKIVNAAKTAYKYGKPIHDFVRENKIVSRAADFYGDYADSKEAKEFAEKARQHGYGPGKMKLMPVKMTVQKGGAKSKSRPVWYG